VAPLKLIFAGSGEFGLPTLRALLDARHDFVQVISQPDRPAGRGRTMTPTPIAAFAASQNLPLLKTANINIESLPPADAMVVIAFGQKIGESIVHHPRLGSVNLHASILPKYRGAAPINWAIIRGERVAGNSVIRLAP
jgi:methionyl-tRNA formyltransferase